MQRLGDQGWRGGERGRGRGSADLRGRVKVLGLMKEKENQFVVVLNIKRLQFNMLEHFLVPSMRILSEIENEKLFQQYNIANIEQMPAISRYDPQALIMCMRPGQICEITRKSPTSLTSNYYRICV